MHIIFFPIRIYQAFKVCVVTKRLLRYEFSQPLCLLFGLTIYYILVKKHVLIVVIFT